MRPSRIISEPHMVYSSGLDYFLPQTDELSIGKHFGIEDNRPSWHVGDVSAINAMISQLNQS